MSFLNPTEFAPNRATVIQENFDLVEARLRGFEHVQVAAASVWTVAHNLGYRPSAVTIWINNQIAFGQVDHVDDNNLLVSFDSAQAGVVKVK